MIMLSKYLDKLVSNQSLVLRWIYLKKYLQFLKLRSYKLLNASS